MKQTLPLRRVDRGPRRQAGFGAVAAIVVVVMLSVLMAAVVRLTWTQAMTSAADTMGAKAFQAANAGTEWGMFQALRGTWALNTACNGASQTINLTASMGFLVTVTCETQTTAFVEGQTEDSLAPGTMLNNSLLLYVITATACNGTTSCPDATAALRPTYVERVRQSIVSNVDPGF